MPQSWGESNQEPSPGQRDGCTGVTHWDQWPRRIPIPLDALPEGARISSEMCCSCQWNLQAKLHTTLLLEASRPDGKLLFITRPGNRTLNPTVAVGQPGDKKHIHEND
jgi:hypothetical protein